MKYVFVDMDGVIAEYGYPNGLYDGEFQKGNYVGKKPVATIINEILEKYNNPDHIIMVCSASPNAKATLEKNDWLNNNFGVPYENRIFITPEEDKVEVIRYYIEDLMHGNVQQHAIIIDDKGSILAKAHSLGIECYHPTQLLALKKIENPQEEQNVEDAVPEQTSDIIEEPEVISPEETVDSSIEGQMTIEDLEQTMNEQDSENMGE
ncbi:MAG: hypothetical protein ACI3T9_03200 [Romboutsia timonensis]